ncbi:MAG: pyridoxal phosphate-dependent aminotransferase [Nitrospinota bacterium]
MELSERVRGLAPAATLEMNTRAAALRAQGLDVLSFAAGEPDFDTPEHVKEAAIRALREGHTKYTAVRGTEALRRAIADWVEREKGLRYSPQQVVVSMGAKHSVFNIALSLFGPGDEVLIPVPAWVSYEPIVELSGARPVRLPTREEDGFRLRPEAVEEAVTPRTKALFLNSPCNPTGAVLRRSDLEAIGEVVARRRLTVISDEIYGKILYDGVEHVSIASLSPELKERTVVVDGLSKTYAMTGWRLGFALGPEHLMGAMASVQSQSTTNPVSFAQPAAIAALEGPQDFLRGWVAEFDRRRRVLVAGLNELPGVSCLSPQGAFYAFPRVRGLFGKSGPEGELRSSLDVASFFLSSARCATVPGVAFGDDGYIRFSFACSVEQVEEGLSRISVAVERLE